MNETEDARRSAAATKRPVSRLSSSDVDVSDPWASWQRLSGRGPVATPGADTESQSWYLLSYQDMRAALQDPAIFSSRADLDAQSTNDFGLVPGELDPPQHTKYRALLNPLFSPRQIAALEPMIRRECQELVDALVEGGSCEFMRDFAFRFPTRVFLGLLGLDVTRTEEFVEYTHRYTRPRSVEDRRSVELEIDAALVDMFTQRRSSPREDLASYLLTCRVDDRPLTDGELLGIGRLLFIAGLDTVAATLGWTFQHLATRPADQATLRSHPDRVGPAVEEFLRYYSVITSARTVLQDTMVGQCPMRAGDSVVIPLAPANRDTGEYQDAASFVIDRTPNRHVGFGLGPHRCLGSHLARTEIRIAIEEWLGRARDLSLGDGAMPTASGLEPLLGLGLSVPMLDTLSLVWSTEGSA